MSNLDFLSIPKMYARRLATHVTKSRDASLSYKRKEILIKTWNARLISFRLFIFSTFSLSFYISFFHRSILSFSLSFFYCALPLFPPFCHFHTTHRQAMSFFFNPIPYPRRALHCCPVYWVGLVTSRHFLRTLWHIPVHSILADHGAQMTDGLQRTHHLKISGENIIMCSVSC